MNFGAKGVYREPVDLKGVLFRGRCSQECHKVNFCSTADSHDTAQFIVQQAVMLRSFLCHFLNVVSLTREE